RVVPLYVRFGDESFKDYVELTPEEFYARLRTADELPTTSQPTPGDFLETYEELAAYDRVYSVHISADLSGTYGSAATAPEQGGGGEGGAGHPRAAGRRREGADDRLWQRLGGDRDAGPRDPAPARPRHDGRGDRRAGRPLPARRPAAVHRRHPRVPTSRRPDRPR